MTLNVSTATGIGYSASSLATGGLSCYSCLVFIGSPTTLYIVSLQCSVQDAKVHGWYWKTVGAGASVRQSSSYWPSGAL